MGVLIWGGVNRTLAKTNNNDGRNINDSTLTSDGFLEGNVAQKRGKGNQKLSGEECDEENHQGNNNGQADVSSEFETGRSSNNLTNTYGQERDSRTGNGNGNGQGGGSNTLTATEVEALHMALDDEYHALAVYQSVLATFGEVDPFVEISLSEQRHIDALINQFNKQSLDIPENNWIGNVPTYSSIEQACQAGVEAETANADLYVQLLSMTDDNRLTRVFTNLSSASINSHLPQFEACQ
jgi:hypothetical protein